MIIGLSILASIILASVWFWNSKEAVRTSSSKLKARADLLYKFLPIPPTIGVGYLSLDRQSVLDGLVCGILIASIIIHLVWLRPREDVYDDGTLSWKDLGEPSPLLGLAFGLVYLVVLLFIG